MSEKMLVLNRPSIKPFDQADQTKEIRCPHCGKMFAKGKFPSDPIEIKCTRCKELITFRRL